MGEAKSWGLVPDAGRQSQGLESGCRAQGSQGWCQLTGDGEVPDTVGSRVSRSSCCTASGQAHWTVEGNAETDSLSLRTKLKPGQALRGGLGLRKAEALGIPAGSVGLDQSEKNPRSRPPAPRPEPIRIGMRGLKVPRARTV